MIQGFEKNWETEYIKSRVDEVSELVENGYYNNATDLLTMIIDKAERAKYIIENSNR